MTVHHETFTLDTRGDGEVIDVTDLAEKSIANSGVAEGTVTVFVAHSTCGVTIIECEPGCNADLNAVLEGIAPRRDAGSTTSATPTRTGTATCAPASSARR